MNSYRARHTSNIREKKDQRWKKSIVGGEGRKKRGGVVTNLGIFRGGKLDGN